MPPTFGSSSSFFPSNSTIYGQSAWQNDGADTLLNPVNQWFKVQGATVSSVLLGGVTAPVSNRLVVPSTGYYDLTYDVGVFAIGQNLSCEFGVFAGPPLSLVLVSASVQESSPRTTFVMETSCKSVAFLNANDIVELWCRNRQNSSSIRILYGTMTAHRIQ